MKSFTLTVLRRLRRRYWQASEAKAQRKPQHSLMVVANPNFGGPQRLSGAPITTNPTDANTAPDTAVRVRTPIELGEKIMMRGVFDIRGGIKPLPGTCKRPTPFKLTSRMLL